MARSCVPPRRRVRSRRVLSLLCVFVLPLALRAQRASGRAGTSTTSPPAVQCAPPDSCVDAPVRRIIGEALSSPTIAENLRRVTDEIGGRMSGSPQMAKAVDWAVEAFRAAGVTDVHTERYTLPVQWSEGATRLDVIAPAPFPVRLVSVGWSPATPSGGITATVVDLGTGDAPDFARAGASVRGAILLVHQPVLRTLDQLFAEYTHEPAVIDRAVASGAAAILWEPSRERLLLYRHINTSDGTLERLPEAIVTREDFTRMTRLVGAGVDVRVRLDLPNHIGGPIDQENVIATIRGRESPEDDVVLAAHLDSWDLGTGALDDGCNAALVIEAARDILSAGVAPRRSVRFMLFSGEEQGMLGSEAYVRAHRAEMDHVDAAMVFDDGVGRTRGFFLGGRRDTEAALRAAEQPIASWGVDDNPPDAIWGSDHDDFLLEGVPTFVANQDEANYQENYHAASDTLDKVDLRDLEFNTAVAATVAFGLADLPQRAGPRLTRAELDTLMQQTGLGDQMRQLGVWDAWANGSRGRAR